MMHLVRTTRADRYHEKLFLLAIVISVFGVTGTAAAGGIDDMAKLHNSDWKRVTPESVAALLDAYQLVRPEEPSSVCAPRYLVFRSRDGKGDVRLRFDVTPSCKYYLSSAHFAFDVANGAEAEKVRLEIVSLIKPGGLPLETGDAYRFMWRSHDSLTRFDLSMRVKTDDHGSHTFVRLDHDSVQPADVDFLPFESGFMCPCTSKSH